MGQVPQKNTLLGGVDMDSDETRILPNRMSFAKGLRYDINKNSGVPTGEGSNFGVQTPFEQNAEVSGITYPSGDNYVIGSYESKDTNELYVFVYNSNGNHFIYRIRGVDGVAQMVYQGECLNFQLAPEHYISEGRCVLITDTYTNEVTGAEDVWKFLIFTDNFNTQRMISVEDSIATNSFNATTYPYFDISGYDCDPCYLINLGLPTPMKCIGIEPLDRDTVTEKNKQNLINNKGWQWRVKHICHWGRESEHGVISDRYFNVIGATCIQSNDGIPRCVELTIDFGCPIVDKIQIEFRNCSGNSAETTDSDWFLYDTIDKYNNCEDGPWYERGVNSELEYDAETNTFKYIFCGDKECQAIPVGETSRTQNPLPILSSTVFPVDKGIGLANNIREFDPLDCDELAKVSYTVTDPPEGCANVMRTVVVYAYIYNPHDQKNAAVFDTSNYMKAAAQAAKASGNDLDPSAREEIVFGLSMCSETIGDKTTGKINYPGVYDQRFAQGYNGFVGYLAGTTFFAVSEQYAYDASSQTFTKVGVLEYGVGQPNSMYDGQNNPTGVWYQRFEFKVPPGKYSFRIANHQASPNSDYQKTSTYVFGTSTVAAPTTVTSIFDKEIIIDCCEGDVESDETLLIYDLSFCAGYYDGFSWARVIDGYAREDKVQNIPIELCGINNATTNGPKLALSFFSDHNGFFFAGAASATQLDINVAIDRCDTIVNRKIWIGDPLLVTHQDVHAMDGFAPYPAAGRREIIAKFTICDKPEIGVSGVAMVMKRGAFAFSDVDGNLTIVAHQRPLALPSQDDVIIRTQRGGCIVVDCDDECETCFDDIDVTYLPCGGARDTDLGIFEVGIRLSGLKGLESGGRYGVGIVMHDWLGRHSFVQSNEDHYVDIPSLTKTQVFDFATVSFTLAPGITFPSWVKYISFYLTENLNNDDYLYWVADKVEFIDNSGNITFVAPTKIRIYYGSLREYNAQNNGATNTNWQFLTAEQTSVVGDYVEFITKSQDTINGDVDWLDKTVTGLVRYDKEGKYFDIDYTEDLSDLKEGALYKLVRPKACITKYIYYEVCSTIRVVDGVPQVLTGMLNAFDSYFVNRQIPVPIETKDSNGDVIKEVVSKYYNISFQHNSPSDFFGYRCANRGRINVKSPYERQKRLGSEVALSKAITNKGTFNGLSYFDSADTTIFLEQEWGNIMVVLPEINNFLFICESNNFVVGYKDTLLQVNDQGNVVSGSSAGGWGTPQRKIGSDYGCQPFDINTIRKNEGIVVFLDRNRYSLLFHNYSDVTDVSIATEYRGGYKSYLNKRIASDNINNISSEPTQFTKIAIAGIDPFSKEYMLTFFGVPRIVGDNAGYVNSELQPNLSVNETMCISLDGGALKCFTGFTPEYYGSLQGYFNEKNMYSFKQGHPWSHRNAGPDFNKFFGTQTKKVVQIVANLMPEKVKKFLYNEVYCKEHKFIIDSIKTESNQLSRLKAVWWDQREKFWCAEFLCASNTFQDPNIPILATAALTDGDPLSGRWSQNRYVSEDADDSKYCELGAIVIYMTATDKSAT